jgi:NSS family neurotransmitter:Na+ symporter
MSKFLIFGKNFFDLMDWTSANLLLPLGGLFITLFVGWVWGPKKTQEELSNKGELSVSYLNIFMFLCRYLAPIAIAVVFLNGVGLLKF